ncbi:hypothetical protein [Methanocorpusculum bavaricum]|uniref:hypothetical protein n=1 Tax=Methanocorpusculum bavaricum TaxID=71518 RepID=UPI0005B28FE7|nr:hypothetical protein [Methanocorpusculum bavaricum]
MQTTETKSQSLLLILHSILRFIPHILLVSSIFIYIVFGILGRSDVMIKASPVLIPLIITSLLLIIWKKPFQLCDESKWVLNLSQKTLLKLFLIALSLQIIWLVIGNGGLLQLILLLVIYCIIILQMLSDKFSSWVIITELIIATSLLILPQLLVSGYYYGDTDLLAHANLASAITFSSHLLPADIAGQYTAFFLYHVLISVSSLFTSLAVNVSLYIVSTIPVICTIPVVYLLARIFTKSERASVFAAFFYSLTPMYLSALLIPAPRVMATAAFFIILYLLFRNWGAHKFAPLILAVCITLYMTMVHHAQLPLFFVVMAFLCFGSFLYFRKIIAGNYGVLIIFISIPTLYLIYNYLTNIVSIIEIRLLDQIDSGTVSSVIISEVGVVDLHSLLILISSSVLVILILMGLYMLLTRISFRNRMMILAPLILVIFIFFVPGVIDIFPTVTQAFQLYRFRLILIAPFAIIMGFGCITLLNFIAEHTSRTKIVTSVVAVLCIILVISSAFLGYSRDNEIFYEIDGLTPIENYFEESDVALFQNIALFIPSGTLIHTNREYPRYYFSNAGIQKYGQSYYRFNSMLPTFTERDPEISSMHYVLFPKSRYDRIGLKIYNTKGAFVESTYEKITASPETTALFENNMRYYKLFYDNGDSQIYNY